MLLLLSHHGLEALRCADLLGEGLEVTQLAARVLIIVQRIRFGMLLLLLPAQWLS